MEKVSIIIPTYKTEEFFDICLQSVMNQTYNNIEIIIVNDGNSTQFYEYLNSLVKDNPRINIINNESRKGTAYSRNAGIEKATGEFLYFLDSDDYIAKDTLKLLVENIKEQNIIKGFIKETYVSDSTIDTSENLFKLKKFKEDRFDLIKDNSVLNCLFRKEYIIKHNIKFKEEVEIYSDLSFIIPAFLHTPSIFYSGEAVYFHRKRNDPINNPSLIQIDSYKRITTYLKLYLKFKEVYSDNLVQDYLDDQLLEFYDQDVIRYFNNEPDAIDKIIKELSITVKEINPNIISSYNKRLRREIKTLKSGNINKYKRTFKQHTFSRNFKRIITSRSLLKRSIYKRIFFKMPLKKELIFFESFLGKNYSDSPKAIYEHLIENQTDYKCVWSFNETGKKIPGNAKQVKRFSLRYFYYVARAKYWVSNSRLPKYLEKRKGNIYLQTWHGTPLKRLVFDMEEVFSADPNYKANFYEQSRRWDYLSSPNKYSTDIFRRAFEFNKEMLEFGYPKNDVLYNKNNKENINSLKSKLDLPLDKKVVLYAPTWRDDDFFARGKYNFELELNLKEMRKRLGDEYIIVLRMHYFIANQLDLTEYEGFAFDYSTYDDIAELYLISDVLITDYSSVFFDYANLKRPILFFTYDIEKYRDQLRGFYLDMEEDLPGPLLMTSKEVIHSLENIEEVSSEYEDKYKQFYERFCQWEDGKASEKTVQAVFKK